MSVDEESARLAVLAEYDLVGPSAPDVADLTVLCELAAQLVDVPTAAINIIDDEVHHLVAAFGCDTGICARSESMCALTVAGGADAFVEDAARDDRFRRLPWVDGRLASVRFYCSIIIRTPDGYPLGTLCVFDDQVRPVVPAAVRWLQMIASQVGEMFELRLRGRRLERTRAELTSTQDQLTGVARRLTHDLRTPLTAVLGFTELLAELPAVRNDDTARAYVARAHASGVRMNATIDQLTAHASG